VVAIITVVIVAVAYNIVDIAVAENRIAGGKLLLYHL
jgi:hypothetical protein